jgi:hypothetical protein
LDILIDRTLSINLKKRLKTPKRPSEAVDPRRIDNATAKVKDNTMIHSKPHRKPKTT